jgi:hypothetical protein
MCKYFGHGVALAGIKIIHGDGGTSVSMFKGNHMTCYMCDKEALSVEHIPPRCLFPEKKDLPEGVDLRKQLITVPACEEHNTAKSQDDEYLLYLLVINLPANETAKNQFLTKIMRSIKCRPGLIKKFMTNQHPVIAVDKQTGQAHHTIAVNIDDERLDSALEHIARALYFHHFKAKWLGSVRTQPDFLLASLDPEKGHERNKLGEQMVAAADLLFSVSDFHGENPDVFKYQVLEGNDNIHKLMRLHFYNGCRVSVFFGAKG